MSKPVLLSQHYYKKVTTSILAETAQRLVLFSNLIESGDLFYEV